MTGKVLVDLTADGQRILLVGSGPAEDIAAAQARISTLTPLVKSTETLGYHGGLWCPASWPAMVQIATELGDLLEPGPDFLAAVSAELSVREAAEAAGNGWQPAYTPPKGAVPFAWQAGAQRMIACVGKALLFDEPGTGKTGSAILGLVERAARLGTDRVFPTVVVCPASVVDPWLEQWEMWAPHFRVVDWRGTPRKRRKLPGQADVYVVSYDTCRNDCPPYKYQGHGPLLSVGVRSIVVDEHHAIKDPAARRTHSVRRLAKGLEQVIGLTGTPIAHDPTDLWPMLDAMYPDAWPSQERWTDRYIRTVRGDYREAIVGLNPGNEPEFRQTLLGQNRRVAKVDVLDKLPPKRYSIRTVDLPAKWRKAYDEFESDMLAELPDDGGELAIMDALAQLTHLSSLACSAADVEVTYELDEETGETKRHVHLELKLPSWKVDALLEVLAERPGDPVVTFAPKAQLVKLAGAAAEKAGYRVGYVIGGQTMRERTGNIRSFQGGDLDLICATTGAGGVGITLTKAATAVFLMRPWSLIESTQAEDRIHRIGSEIHERIEIIDIVARNTIDSRVRSVLKGKGDQFSQLVKDPRIVAELLGGASVTRLPERKTA